MYAQSIALLPAGSGERSRLLIYRTHPYRQLGQIEVAGALYHQARQADELANAEPARALRGLVWCDALNAVGAPAEVETMRWFAALKDSGRAGESGACAARCSSHRQELA